MKARVRFHAEGRIRAQSDEIPNMIGCGEVSGRQGNEQKQANQVAEIYAGFQGAVGTAERQEQPWVYRDHTVALLKHYARMAVESGRLASLLGRECFRSRVTPYAMASFEDMAIFVHDMERALNRLDNLQQQLITLNVLEEFSQWEIARLLGCTTRWIEWQVSDALDELSGVLVGCGLVRTVGEEPVTSETRLSAQAGGMRTGSQNGTRAEIGIENCQERRKNESGVK